MYIISTLPICKCWKKHKVSAIFETGVFYKEKLYIIYIKSYI